MTTGIKGSKFMELLIYDSLRSKDEMYHHDISQNSSRKTRRLFFITFFPRNLNFPGFAQFFFPRDGLTFNIWCVIRWCVVGCGHCPGQVEQGFLQEFHLGGVEKQAHEEGQAFWEVWEESSTDLRKYRSTRFFFSWKKYVHISSRSSSSIFTLFSSSSL